MTRPRSTVARHAASHGPARLLSRMFKGLAVGLAVVLVSGGAVAAYYALDLVSTLAGNSVALEGQGSEPPDFGAIEGGIDILVIATDECRPEYAQYFGDRCKGAEAANELNDVNMLVHISDAPRRVTVVSFPRDLLIPIPSCTSEDGTVSSAMEKQPLNSAYSYGGLSCVAKTITALTKIEIDGAAKVNFGGVINITNAIGGVDVCIGNEGIRDLHTGINWPAGPRTIVGLDAVQFLRTRYGVGGRSDLSRISNQQQYMSSLARKLVSDGVLSDPATLLRLATAAVQNVVPSESIGNPVALVQIALAVKGVPFDDIVFAQYPSNPDWFDTDRVVPDEPAAEALLAALAANEPISLAAQGDGVLSTETVSPSVPPTDGAAPSASASPSTGAPSPSASSPAVPLPPEVTGQTADDRTCSAGVLN